MALSLALLIGSIDTAKAADIRTITYVGTVSELCEPMMSPPEACDLISTLIPLGEPINLEIYFDATTPDSQNSDPNIGRYTDSITAITLEIGSYLFNLDSFGSSQIFLVNDLSGTFDQFTVDADLIGPDLVGADAIDLILNITDPTGSMFSDDSLPAETPFSTEGFRFFNLTHNIPPPSDPMGPDGGILNCPCSNNFVPFTAALEVGIDIKPSEFPNSINLGSGGGTPVAILGSEDFDVFDINPDTLTLGTAGVKTVGMTETVLCAVEDVSGDFSVGPEGAPDGHLDLVCHFETMVIVPEEGETEAVLAGELNDETPISGSDSVEIHP